MVKVPDPRLSKSSRGRDPHLMQKYVGPLQIIKRIGTVAYKIELSSWWKIHSVFHVSQLKKYSADKEDDARNQPSRPQLQLTKMKEKVAEAILNHRVTSTAKRTHNEYLVKWKGCSSEENTWEWVTNLKAFLPLVEAYHASHAPRTSPSQSCQRAVLVSADIRLLCCYRAEVVVYCGLLATRCPFLRIAEGASLEVWYYTALILFAGYLKNAEVAVDALSICINILSWTVTVALGFNAAISVRVSNELGAGHPRSTKFSVLVLVILWSLIALFISIIILIFQDQYPSIFSKSSEVKQIVSDLTPLLAFCILLNNIQPALSGVAIGAGWQTVVAYVNIACYYLFGVPMGGIWCGMISGTVVQTLILFWITYRTNWKKEASVAVKRIKKWGGEPIC
ncbi:protein DETOXIFICATION 29 [Sesamum angolense]|uniref:Protein DETOXIFICATION 29 n=1 Tax=Sesamum angolense TaxID=2727404 RepID=A0AAE1X002_9LAMI|nr:protein DETOXIFICATION 29 [Sesamum angolense]